MLIEKPEEFAVHAKHTIKLLNDASVVAHMCHWNVRGPNYYEGHLLFDRIYTTLEGLMDGLVERLRACGFNPDFDQFVGPGISMQVYDCKFLLSLALDYVMAINSMVFVFFQYTNSGENPQMVGLADYLQSMSSEILHLQGLLQQALGL
jgi:hypothetical protein